LHRGCRYGDSGAGVALVAVVTVKSAAAVIAAAITVAAIITGARLETDQSTREEARRAKVPHKSPRAVSDGRTFVVITTTAPPSAIGPFGNLFPLLVSHGSGHSRH